MVRPYDIIRGRFLRFAWNPVENFVFLWKTIVIRSLKVQINIHSFSTRVWKTSFLMRTNTD